jgi:hypothetical protein
MSEVQLPETVETFIETLQFYLGLIETEAEFVDRVDGEQTLWSYRVVGALPETNIMIHQTQESMGSSNPRFRVRIVTPIDGEMGALFHGMGSGINRFTMLGALILHSNRSATVGAQFILGDGNVYTCAALAATAAARNYDSLVGSVRQSVSGEQPKVVQLSSWSGIDFERVQYAFAHLGVAHGSDREFVLRSIWGDIQLISVNSNPYWGGGLLVLVSHNKPGVDLEDSVLANEMNIFELLASDIPMFGGWCVDGDKLRFVSFFPNFIKEADQLLEHVVSWGVRRLRSVDETTSAATELHSRIQK